MKETLLVIYRSKIRKGVWRGFSCSTGSSVAGRSYSEVKERLLNEPEKVSKLSDVEDIAVLNSL